MSSEEHAFEAPKEVILSGEGLRNLDEAEYIQFVGEMAGRGILVTYCREQEATPEDDELTWLVIDDFDKAAGKHSTVGTMTFNALSNPGRCYRDAIRKQADGADLGSFDEKALRIPTPILAISPQDYLIDLDALIIAQHLGILKQVRGIGVKAVDLIGAVIEQAQQGSSEA